MARVLTQSPIICNLFCPLRQEEKEINNLSNPEVLWAIDEFELACFSDSSEKESLEHPESSAAEQKFLNHLKEL